MTFFVVRTELLLTYFTSDTMREWSFSRS